MAARHADAMRFFSDNAAAACPAVMAALADANQLDTAYDGDAWSQRLDGAFSDLFEREVRALWVTTGTAANCLGLAALCPPTGAILCHEQAHIEQDEAGAPGFFTHGAKLTLLPGEGAKVTPDDGRGSVRARALRRPPGAAVRAVDHQCHRIWPELSRRRSRRAGRRWRRRASWASTWTARGSPMRWPSPAKARPI